MLLASLVLLAAPKPVPGVVIDHFPASSKTYVGSPSLAILPGGDYVASHDEFGPGGHGSTRIFRSSDRGRTWNALSSVRPAAWSGLFVHRGALYLMGNYRGYGQFAIRRSDDGGETWTPPTLLPQIDRAHTAPTAVVEAHGRIWRAVERRPQGADWGTGFQAGMLSAPVDADLLDPDGWRLSNLLSSDRKWNGGDMYGWLEGNAVVAPDGSVVDMLRVDVRRPREKAALIRLSPDGSTASFDPHAGLVDFPGGSKKFTVRYDPQTRRYWSLASVIADRFRHVPPSRVRNTLALTSSPDLVHWTVRRTILSSTGVHRTGFQYADWLFDGDDLVAVVRTAFDGARTAHDANYLTFHRVVRFRDDR